MKNRPATPIVLTFGRREILANRTTTFASATLERLLPALVMPEHEAFDFVEAARRKAYEQAGMAWDADDEAAQAARDVMREFVKEQQFLQRQVLDFAFPALFHFLERAVQEILRDADTLYGGAVLKGKEPPKEFKAMLCVLAQRGYATEGKSFTHDLNKLNLISNAVKHGRGQSLTRLAKKFPDLFYTASRTRHFVPNTSCSRQNY
jgi:hypothetical protein